MSPVLIAGLSTGHTIGLSVVAAVFIAFALVSSFVAPRFRPDFPGKAGLSVFVIACFVLFASMITAVEVFGAESEAKASGGGAAAAGQTVTVQEKEFKITLGGSAKKLEPGKVTFVVKDTGKLQHDLAIKGPGLKQKQTSLLSPGKGANLTVTLEKGTYIVWCTVPGHRQLGMVAKLHVR
jgi:uncharacterized cupredoxin-like copper-binding protein